MSIWFLSIVDKKTTFCTGNTKSGFIFYRMLNILSSSSTVDESTSFNEVCQVFF